MNFIIKKNTFRLLNISNFKYIGFKNIKKNSFFKMSRPLSKTNTNERNELTKEAEYLPILKYWFGEDLNLLKSDDYQGNNSLWFGSNIQTDEYIRTNFSRLITDAENDRLNEWKKESRGCLSIIILLDQFSRNVYRGTPKMFANDKKALDIALDLIENRKIEFNELSLTEKNFVYMPLMHSEELNILKKCVQCFKDLTDLASHKKKKSCEYTLKFAQEHHDIIEKFGRYPHRNELLSRESTKEELEFLEKNSISFSSSVKPISK